MRRLSRAAFMNWLKSFSAKKVVGISTKPEQCPISQFLGEGISVDGSYYGPPDEDGMIFSSVPGVRKTPGWARKFIELIDRTFMTKGQYSYNEAGDITAARALEVLRKAR